MSDKLKKSKELKPGAVLSQKDDSSLKYQTGTWKTFRPIIDEEKCVYCMQCVLFCPENCIAIKRGGKRGDVNLDYCKGCGICAAQCPVGAIKMVKVDSDEEKELLEKNKNFKNKK